MTLATLELNCLMLRKLYGRHGWRLIKCIHIVGTFWRTAASANLFCPWKVRNLCSVITFSQKHGSPVLRSRFILAALFFLFKTPAFIQSLQVFTIYNKLNQAANSRAWIECAIDWIASRRVPGSKPSSCRNCINLIPLQPVQRTNPACCGFVSLITLPRLGPLSCADRFSTVLLNRMEGRGEKIGATR